MKQSERQLKASPKKQDKEYKRSDSKVHNKKKIRSRSDPKVEYNLVDATAEEKELVLKGSIKDRINCLSLLCAKNGTPDNFKQLLCFCEYQRNDVIFIVLKNLKDILKEVPVEDFYIKSRIIKSFEMGAKNQYIKDKVIDLIGILIRADIFAEDFISILVARLIEKGATLKLVQDALKTVFKRHEDFIIMSVEDFYYKNNTFKNQYYALKFLASVEPFNKKPLFSFYDQALVSIDNEYPADQKDLLMDLIINGLSSTITEESNITGIELIRSYIKSAKTIISSLNLLFKIKDAFLETFVLRAVKSSLLRGTKYESDFLNLLYGMDNGKLITKLVNNCFFYSVEYILSIMMLFKGDSKVLYGLRMLVIHYHPVVRSLSLKILKCEPIDEFDPYDSVMLSNLCHLSENQ